MTNIQSTNSPINQFSNQLKWVYGISALFIALNAFFITNEFYWFSLLPIVLIILLLALFSLDKLVLLIVLLTPFSITLEQLDLGLGISLPTEPLMFGVMIVFIVKQFYEGGFDKNVIVHPISIAIIINLVWIAITCITSEMPIVSLKFLIARLWFVITFYFVCTQLFKDPSNIKRFLWLYLIAFTGVIFYTLFRLWQYDFDEYHAHRMMRPFYKNHTSYGAIMAMFLPVLIGFSLNNKQGKNLKMISIILLLIYCFAMIFSYTRAAWVSLLAALCIYLIIALRLKLRTILLGTVVFIGLFLAFQNEIIIKLEKNKQESSGDFTEHVQSVANIASDASNLERINRWNSALRMFAERPVFGWGPGTYMFLYAPFQHSSDRTIISTNVGDKGNAHSEYIGPLAESGVLGALSFILIAIYVIYTGMKLCYKAENREVRLLALVILLGLITYFVHGMLNNYLDTDKASVPFWGFIAMLTALDVYHKKGIKLIKNHVI